MNYLRKKAFKKVRMYSNDIENLYLFGLTQERNHGDKYLISWVCTMVNFRISRQNAKKNFLKWLFNIN